MFGLIISGRLVQTDPQQLAETQFVFSIPDVDNVNHVVVFLTGQMAFPEQLGAAVYFSFPNPQGQSWQLLGCISNSKPSAIFKITKLKQEDGSVVAHPFGQGGGPQAHMAQIGISVEPLSQLSQLTPVAQAKPSSVEPFVEFSQKMLENFFNYASSFGLMQAQMTPNPSETYVPLSTLQSWFQTFQRRLQQNPYFWRS
ncbi:protein Hikeshi-like isoform X2 [Mizuhopecten yessoensis]|uniref:Protein Hikeshi n=1 Tax=Mizuhopecten yessoensis TaxID=6573 RepID=A0A210R221_MIZYE|nr:protein Hikeshi-like isoform X1 [Mizuhopecten yessoensis]XP_021377718.1 protein Hikeshi-like isoform X2 [Mizuhopecten yessoensis]OWF54945.1 Protein Hikeshi [Mizuhopecten yessoensis]